MAEPAPNTSPQIKQTDDKTSDKSSNQQNQSGNASANSDPKAEAAALLDTLKGLGVTSPDAAQNMAVASREAGNLARMLGDERKERARLQDELSRLRASSGTNANNQPNADNSQTNADGTIDLRSVIRNELNSFWQDQQRENQNRQEAINRAWSEVKGDSDYSRLEKAFNKYLENPEVGVELSTGRKSLRDAYMDVKLEFYKEVIGKSEKTISDLLGGNPQPKTTNAQSDIPFYERGQPAPTRRSAQSDEERAEKLSKLKEKPITNLDNAQSVLDVMRTLLP